MTKKNVSYGVWMVLAFLLALIACRDNGSDPPPPTPPADPLELLYPVGGESFAVGGAVTVRWSINDTTRITSVMVTLSINNGKTYDFILSSAGSIPPAVTSLAWPVESSQVSTQCRIRIYDYQDGSINDHSGVFTVHN